MTSRRRSVLLASFPTTLVNVFAGWMTFTVYTCMIAVMGNSGSATASRTNGRVSALTCTAFTACTATS